MNPILEVEVTSTTQTHIKPLSDGAGDMPASALLFRHVQRGSKSLDSSVTSPVCILHALIMDRIRTFLMKK